MEMSKINCRVVEVNPDADSLEDALGISNDRLMELHKMVMHGIIDDTNVSALLVRLSEHCNHPNELVVVCWVTHKYLTAKRDTGGNFAEFLKQFRG